MAVLVASCAACALMLLVKCKYCVVQGGDVIPRAWLEFPPGGGQGLQELQCCFLLKLPENRKLHICSSGRKERTVWSWVVAAVIPDWHAVESHRSHDSVTLSREEIKP